MGVAKKRIIDTDEKSIRLIIEGINYAKIHNLVWKQSTYGEGEKSNAHPCGTYACILGHLGNKYNRIIGTSDDLLKIVDTNSEQKIKLTTCFMCTQRSWFLQEVELHFGRRARIRIEKTLEGVSIDDGSSKVSWAIPRAFGRINS